MYLPFEKLPDSAKVWIYQSDKRLTSREKEIISSALSSFTNQWLVHGHPLEASFEIRFDRFVIIAANDTASGCSIDTSVKVMKELGQAISIDFFNRNLVAFSIENEPVTIPIQDLKIALAEGRWNETTLMYNNAVSTMAQYKSEWISRAGHTWLKRYLSQKSVA